MDIMLRLLTEIARGTNHLGEALKLDSLELALASACAVDRGLAEWDDTDRLAITPAGYRWALDYFDAFMPLIEAAQEHNKEC